MRRMKKWITVPAALLLVIVMTAGALAEALPAPAELFGKPWYNTTVFGNLPESAPKAADDLYSCYNYDFAAAHQNAPANASRGDSTDVFAAMKDALADESADDPALKQLRIFYEQALDTETRKKGNGMDELLPWLKRVADAKSLQQLEEVILAEDFPFCPFMKLYVSNDFATGTNCVNIAINLTVSDEPAYYDPPKDPLDMQIKILAMGEKFQSLVCLYLMCGLDMDNAATAAMGVVNMERTWALLGDSPLHYTEREYGACAKDTRSLTLDELAAYCPHFPLKETLKKFGKDQSERYVCTAPQWLTALDGVWTEENLNSLRELIMAKVMLECSPYIDRSAYSQALAALGTPAETPEANAWAVCSDPGTFGQLIARLYTERVLGNKVKDRLTEMAKGLLEEMRGLISETAWVSEEARARAIEKTESMKLNILEPEGGYLDYSDLSLRTSEEGGTLLDNYFRIKAWRNEADNARIGTPGLSRLTWDLTSPVKCNAYYDPASNSINILPGYLSGGKYADDMSDLDLLGSIGTTIGHEISHGFDFIGSQFDASGAPALLFTKEDEAAFLARVKKLTDYFSTIEILPDVYENGDLLKVEAAADLIGLRLALSHAKRLGYLDLEPFFGSYARLYAMTSDMMSATTLAVIDTHPAQYLRVNVNAQMMDEFHETYGVKEGNNMYVAPESRLRIWGAD